ncbi:hypothetical protein [Maledivibacter halophilus]|uniref:Uncharacterized protein n=1 Tax=Maledivibacter halophilus TaxID=36842 RepID=A0A1T5KDI1_9FIRM|nr:hypothetical protein [Maledivibacter halophilus]SKC61737.1 hypothetical protein SAMN02194393_01711 [Maledivibacter halophilus]
MDCSIKNIKDDLCTALVNQNKDLVIDLSELSLDLVFDEGLTKDIPLLRTISAIYKTGINIKDRHFTKKLIAFINDFNQTTITEKRYIEFRTKMQDTNYKVKAIEDLIVIIDRARNYKKIKWITNLFKSYIEKNITWAEFCEFCDYTGYLVISDLRLLKKLLDAGTGGKCLSYPSNKNEISSAYKLINCNLVCINMTTDNFLGTTPVTTIYYITDNGIKFINSIK